MKRDKLAEAFQLLYPMQDYRILQQEYRKKRIRETIFVLTITLLLFGAYAGGLLREGHLTSDNRIVRQTQGGAATKVWLQAQLSDQIQEVELTIQPRSYTQEELEELFERMGPELEQQVLGNNVAANQVRSALCFLEQVEGYPFTLEYEERPYELIGADGSVLNEHLSEEGIAAQIGIRVSGEGFSRVYPMQLRILPPLYSEAQRLQKALEECLLQEEANTREQESVMLPNKWGDSDVLWKERSTDHGMLFLLFGALCIPLLWMSAKQKIEQQVKNREKALCTAYPDFVSRLTLLLGAGMTLRGAVSRMVQEERKKEQPNKKEQTRNYIYEELQILCNEMEAGVPEGQAYLSFGNRCGLQQYRRLVTLLNQNLKKGSKNLMAQLEYETHQALADKRAQAKQWGEEAGSKLLLPMTIMLLIVMIMIIVPAFGSFQL